MPAEARSELRIECSVRGNRHHDRRAPAPVERTRRRRLFTTRVAQLRYDSGLWTLFCSDSNDRWWLYDETSPAPHVGPLLAAIDDDATGIFWG